MILKVIGFFDKDLKKILIMNGRDYKISKSKIEEDFDGEFIGLEKMIFETRESLEKFELSFE